MLESLHNRKKVSDEESLLVHIGESKEIESLSVDRYTIIRNQSINTSECCASFGVPTQLGIKVLTDSKKLAEEIELAAKDKENTISTIDLVYLTKKNIDPVNESEISPRPISKGVLGDLVVDQSLTQYGLAGPDKFGSVESVLFGIYSFERAEGGFLGMHAAQIYDRKNGVNHVVIGDSGMGKSTLAQFLENIKPDRFEVLADDWVEFNQNQNGVRPVSMTFGSNDDTLNNELVISNKRVGAKFTSFGKNFHTYDSTENAAENIGSVIQLYDPLFKSTDEEMIAYFTKLNRHIPFITQAAKEIDLLPPKVNGRLKSILQGYSRLRNHESFLVLDLNGLDINQKIGKILNVLG